jgi:type I restriction enzyme, S subunit
MIKLNQLINDLCPDGVEYESLGKILINNNASESISKKDYKEVGEIPIIDQSQLYISAYTDNLSAIPPILPCIIFGDHTRVVKYANQKFAQGDSGTKIFVPISDKLNTKYIYYAFLNLNIPSRGYNRHWSIVKDMEVPLPPLPIQEEIVHILDKYTALKSALESELEAELVARKKQYEYYRDNILLNTNSNYKQEKIGDVCLRTENIDWSKTDDLVFKYIDLTSVDRETHTINETTDINSDTAPSRAQKIVITDDIIFGTTRPTLKRVCIIPQEYNKQICSTGFCVLRADKTKALPKFLYHHISKTGFYDYIERMQQGSAYPSVSDIDVKIFKIPIPPLEEQERIAAILDRFETLVNDITQGLPAEIAARRKQYEYYRDKLLTFKEKSS